MKQERKCNVCGGPVPVSRIPMKDYRCRNCINARRRQIKADPSVVKPKPEARPLTDEQRKLVDSVVDMAGWAYGKFTAHDLTPDQRDTFMSIAFSKFIQAAQAFKPEKGMEFTTYVGNVVRREAHVWYSLAKYDLARSEWLALTRHNSGQTRSDRGYGVSERLNARPMDEVVYRTLSGDAVGKATLQEIIADPRDYYEHIHDDESDKIRAIQEAFMTLPDEWRAVLEARLREETFDVIAGRVGCSRQRVQQIETKAIRQVRNVLRGMGYDELDS